jgi:hypothetical protein
VLSIFIYLFIGEPTCAAELGQTVTSIWSDVSHKFSYGFGQIVEGLKIIFGIFVVMAVVVALGAGKKTTHRRKKGKSGGPIGGSHTVEGMLFDKHYDNVPAVWAARKVRDKFFRF